MKTRAEHTEPTRTGLCRRCALSPKSNGGKCPPGYWMTKTELAEWTCISTVDRRVMEKALGSMPAPRRKQ